VEFDLYTAPMKHLLQDFVEHPQADYVVFSSSAHPRLVNGKTVKKTHANLQKTTRSRASPAIPTWLRWAPPIEP